MLQRQQSQLNAGVQELYGRLLDGRGWPGKPLEVNCNGQALVHAILERLSLLDENDGWNEIEDSEPEQQMPEDYQSSLDKTPRFSETPLQPPPAVSLSKQCFDSPISPLINSLFSPIAAFPDTITDPQLLRNYMSVDPKPLPSGGYPIPSQGFIPISPDPFRTAGWTNGGDWNDFTC